jgi:cytochrome b6-f complex iron-sulfur subunit
VYIMEHDNVIPVNRRTIIAGAGAVAGVFALTSCADDAEPVTQSEQPAQPGQMFTLTTVSQVPVGGVVSVPGPDDKPVLVSQPEPGVVKAFDSTCTHKGCTVDAREAKLQCPCHGAAFDPASGAPTTGPAKRPLAQLNVHIDDQGNVHVV